MTVVESTEAVPAHTTLSLSDMLLTLTADPNQCRVDVDQRSGLAAVAATGRRRCVDGFNLGTERRERPARQPR